MDWDESGVTRGKRLCICTKSFTSLGHGGEENEAEKWFRPQQPDNSIVRYLPLPGWFLALRRADPCVCFPIPFAHEPTLIIPVPP